jgi:leader peptidase (prepilin peptidase)/N-methyltransferase
MKPCRACGQKVSKRSWIVLICAVLTSLLLWIHPVRHLGYGLGMVLLVYLAVVAVIDLEYRLVLQPVSYFGFALGLGLGFWIHGWWQTLLGGAVGFAFMLVLYYLGALFARWWAHRRGEENDEVALGYGDVMLSGVLGLLLGWPGIIAGLVLGIMLGGVASLIYLAWRVVSKSYQPFMAIPYAPFLVLGAVILLYRS